MNARRFAVSLALLAAAVLSVGHPPAFAQDAGAVFERLLNKYHAITGLRAAFTQTTTSAYADGEDTFRGVLILQGEKYRVETGAEILVVDGEVLTVYRPVEKQVLINDVTEDENSFSPSEFLLHYDRRFEVAGVETAQLGGQRHFKLRLRPKNPDSFFREATLWMRDRDDLITRLELTDANETRMVFTLTDIELNPVLDAATFTFTPPEGVEVIDLRS